MANINPVPSPEAGIDHSGPQSGVKPANSTKIINTSPHAHGSPSHPEMGGENPKQGHITQGKG